MAVNGIEWGSRIYNQFHSIVNIKGERERRERLHINLKALFLSFWRRVGVYTNVALTGQRDGMWLHGGLWLDCHMSEGASIETACHSQIRRKLVEALDVNSIATKEHVRCWMSIAQHAYCSWKSGSGLSHRKSSFSTRPKEECWREQEPGGNHNCSQ